MSEPTVTLKSRDGRSTVKCNERVAAALIKTGKYVRAPIEVPAHTPQESASE